MRFHSLFLCIITCLKTDIFDIEFHVVMCFFLLNFKSLQKPFHLLDTDFFYVRAFLWPLNFIFSKSFLFARINPFLSYLKTLMEFLFLLQKIKTLLSEKGSILNCMFTIETRLPICLRKSVAPMAR